MLTLSRIVTGRAFCAALMGLSAGLDLGCQSSSPRPRFVDERRASPDVGTEIAPSVRAYVETAPRETAYQPELLGAEPTSIAIVVTNDGARDIATDALTVRFRAQREGVEFPCDQSRFTIAEREPNVLLPGQSYTFRRDIGCTFALPGNYDVDVTMAGRESQTLRSIGRFVLSVKAKTDAPHAIASMPGVFAIMVGANVVEPLSQQAWAKSDYRVSLAIINGSKAFVHLPKARLSFLTFKKGTLLPCSGEAEPIVIEADIAPGRSAVARVALACAPSEVGRYAVLGRLVLADDSGTDVGRFWLRIESEPVFDVPPEPPYFDRAGRVLW
jgi:hypothetical protein